MALEKTMSQAEAHTMEEWEAQPDSISTKELLEKEKEVEIVDTEASEVEIEQKVESSEGNETIESLKERLKKSEEEKDHYRRGLLSVKAKSRSLSVEGERTETPSEDTVEEDDEMVAKGKIDERVRAVLYREHERKVMREVLDPKSDRYLPELLEDERFNEIVEYLPKNIDKSSENSIHRALKIAIHSWKYDRGIVDEKPKERKKTNDLVSVSSGISSGEKSSSVKKSKDRKILKQQPAMQEWY